jgi:cell division protein FtsQ
VPARARFSRSVARAEGAVIPWRLRWPELRPRDRLAGLAPTRRSLAVGFGIVAFALCAYVIARESSLFAIDRVEVRGGSPRIASDVRRAVADVLGKPLVGLDGARVLREVDALPTVVSASYDRAFPHTLRITIVPERPAAVLRNGANSWLVSARGRVMEHLASGADPSLPRVWISGRPALHDGTMLVAGDARVAVRAAGLAGPLARRITTASYVDGALVFHLRSGLQLLLGDAADVKLKVAVAERALAVVPSASTYLDVSVPGRAVSGTGQPYVNTPEGSSKGR